MTTDQPINAAPYMWVFGVIVFIGFFLYLLFIAINTLGLDTQKGYAEVTDKSYQKPHTTYIVQNVGGQNLTLPQSVDGAYILHLTLKNDHGKKDKSTSTYVIVSQDNYETTYVGQGVEISYQTMRLTNTIQVTHTTF